MIVQSVGANVIVAANQFNPSVFSPLWFAKCGLFTEEDIGPGCVVGDGVVQITNSQFMLLVVSSQLQFTPGEQIADQQQLIEQKVGGIVATLPHTPYTAVGLNFVWHVRDEEETTQQLSRDLFFKEGSDLYQRFNTDDAVFGAYLSRDFRGCRQKLDIKPVTQNESGVPESLKLQLAFNFHRVLTDGEDSVLRIQEMLKRWDEFREESGQVAESLRRRV